MTEQASKLRGYFVTGSDTGVGKTWVACRLVERWRSAGILVRVRKPVESGCMANTDGRLCAADGEALALAAGGNDCIDLVTPYRFAAALAPDRAAQMAHMQLDLDHLDKAVRAGLGDDDFVLVEGAGGICSPITADGLNADLARRLQLPLIIVVDDRLGAINQALMATRAAAADSLEVAALILNQRSPPSDPDMNNLEDLSARLELPIYACPYAGALPEIPL
jgi:dethiobiotin synthetase